jgi:hypothetical protein
LQLLCVFRLSGAHASTWGSSVLPLHKPAYSKSGRQPTLRDVLASIMDSTQSVLLSCLIAFGPCSGAGSTNLSRSCRSLSTECISLLQRPFSWHDTHSCAAWMPLQTVAVGLLHLDQHLLAVDSSMMVLADQSPHSQHAGREPSEYVKMRSSQGSWLSTGSQRPLGQGGCSRSVSPLPSQQQL